MARACIEVTAIRRRSAAGAKRDQDCGSRGIRSAIEKHSDPAVEIDGTRIASNLKIPRAKPRKPPENRGRKYWLEFRPVIAAHGVGKPRDGLGMQLPARL